jgi:hypothetical protein
MQSTRRPNIIRSSLIAFAVISVAGILLANSMRVRDEGGSEGASAHICQAFSNTVKVVHDQDIVVGVSLPKRVTIKKIRLLARDSVGVNNHFGECPENGVCPLGRSGFDSCGLEWAPDHGEGLLNQVLTYPFDKGQGAGRTDVETNYHCTFHNTAGNMERFAEIKIDYASYEPDNTCKAVDWKGVPKKDNSGDFQRPFSIETPPNATLMSDLIMTARDAKGVNSHSWGPCTPPNECAIGSSRFWCRSGETFPHKVVHEPDGSLRVGACFTNDSTGTARYAKMEFSHKAPYSP